MASPTQELQASLNGCGNVDFIATAYRDPAHMMMAATAATGTLALIEKPVFAGHRQTRMQR
eukprot:8650295-Alexandrium_andersonii.AAC.1